MNEPFRSRLQARLVAMLRPSRGDLGPVTIALLAAADALLWLTIRPASDPFATHLGQLFGAESILLLSVALVLISTLPWVETWFDGIDRAAIWHRRAAIAGLVLLAPHILLAKSRHDTTLGVPLAAVATIGLAGLAGWSVLPRWRDLAPQSLRGLIRAVEQTPPMRLVHWLVGGYERWRLLHRLTGLFVAAGFVHGLLDATSFAAAPILRWSYVVVGGVDLAFYAYRELLARWFWPMHDYQVETVTTIGDGLVEIALTPVGRPLVFAPGQFAMLFLELKDGWRRHPFTIASAPHEGRVRVAVKALGDYTARLEALAAPGMPAVISGPHGRFDWRRGTQRQLWVAAGVGVAPFLSWLRALDERFGAEVDFFYTTVGPAPFAEEIRAIAARHPSVRVHVVDTSRQSRLAPAQLLAAAGAPLAAVSVYLCGPHAMLQRFQADLRRAGVPRAQLHREYFNWR